MTQPTFNPIDDASAVRKSTPTPTPELGRPLKVGLLRSPTSKSGRGRGTPGPDGGYALRLADHLGHQLVLTPRENLHDVEVGLAALATKRAGLAGRGPTMTDLKAAADLFGFRDQATEELTVDRLRRFSGLGHSYFALRRFVDSVSDAALRQDSDAVRTLLHFN